MNQWSIRKFIKNITEISKIKLWIPIVFTVLFSIGPIRDCFNAAYEYLELSSYLMFRLIEVIFFWQMYYWFRRYTVLNVYIIDHETTNPPLFDEQQEHTFRIKAKKYGLSLLLLFIVLLLFEGFRILNEYVSLSSSIQLSVLIVLIISCAIFYIACNVKFNELHAYLKSITIDLPQ